MAGPTETLREQQKRLAQERIVDAAAEEIVGRGLDQLSMPAVARTAGVSLRTVYNYFDSRELLIDAVGELAARRIDEAGAIDVADDLAAMPDAIRHNWPIFAGLGTLGDAWSVIRVSQAVAGGRSTSGTTNRDLDAMLRTSFAELTANLEPAQQEAVLAVIRGMAASETFYRMRQLGVGAAESAEVTAWAFDRLRAALEAGDGPF